MSTTSSYFPLEVLQISEMCVSLQTKAGAKGYGLCAAEPIKAGQYLIEYIGEVLEEEEYNRRKDYYAGTGQRHYYFMNIGNGEVIDACRKVSKNYKMFCWQRLYVRW